MADLVPNSPNIDANTLIKGATLNGIAAAAIDACAPCTYDANGQIVMSDGTAVNAAAAVVGVSVRDALAGEPITLAPPGTRINYDKAGGLTPGTALFVSANAGKWADAASLGDTVGIGKVISPTTILFLAGKATGG